MVKINKYESNYTVNNICNDIIIKLLTITLHNK